MGADVRDAARRAARTSITRLFTFARRIRNGCGTRRSGVPFTASDLTTSRTGRTRTATDSDMLLVYAPGSSPDNWPDGMAKLVPAGSDLVFQMHYTTHGHAASDQTSMGIVFAKQPPKKRVLTLQLTDDQFVIPPGVRRLSRGSARHAAERRAAAQLFPAHASARKAIRIQHRSSQMGAIEPLLRVNYDFYWQMSYRLADAAAAEGGNGAAGGRVVRQFEEQSAQSRSRTPRSIGAIRRTMK